jgi:hypothetical protein
MRIPVEDCGISAGMSAKGNIISSISQRDIGRIWRRIKTIIDGSLPYMV